MNLAALILIAVAYAFIALEHVTRVSKSAVAIVAGVSAWIVLSHAHDCVPHVAYIGSIVLYLLAVNSIVDVLRNNGCFDFIVPLLRTRSTSRLLWGAVGTTFLLSANFDNLTTAVLMLSILRRLLQSERQRRLVGAAVVIAACAGGSFTVIGDYTSLMLWAKGGVTPTSYSAHLVLPALVGTAIPTLLIRQALPEHLDLTRLTARPFRVDDSALSLWIRITLFVRGVGGLWLIPTFHRLTTLPPFLGALCVLGVVWVLNEVFNARQISSEQPLHHTQPTRRLYYEVLQVAIFFIGVALLISALIEVGAMDAASAWLDRNVHDPYILSLALGVASAVVDNVALVFSAINVYDVLPTASTTYEALFVENGAYWHLVMISAAMGGCLLPIGSTAGYALMKSEDAGFLWYVRNITVKVALGWVGALVTYFVVDYLTTQ